MNKALYEAYLADPAAVRTQVQREASRARAEAMHQDLLMPLARFCAKLVALRGLKLQLQPRGPGAAA